MIQCKASWSSFAMMVVAHKMEFDPQVSNRVGFMDGGTIVEQGHPAGGAPATPEERTRRFLARYNGSIANSL